MTVCKRYGIYCQSRVTVGQENPQLNSLIPTQSFMKRQVPRLHKRFRQRGVQGGTPCIRNNSHQSFIIAVMKVCARLLNRAKASPAPQAKGKPTA